jgi:predicted small secreted protein
MKKICALVLLSAFLVLGCRDNTRDTWGGDAHITNHVHGAGHGAGHGDAAGHGAGAEHKEAAPAEHK